MVCGGPLDTARQARRLGMSSASYNQLLDVRLPRGLINLALALVQVRIHDGASVLVASMDKGRAPLWATVLPRLPVPASRARLLVMEWLQLSQYWSEDHAKSLARHHRSSVVDQAHPTAMEHRLMDTVVHLLLKDMKHPVVAMVINVALANQVVLAS
jgi:hypothetical protein